MAKETSSFIKKVSFVEEGEEESAKEESVPLTKEEPEVSPTEEEPENVVEEKTPWECVICIVDFLSKEEFKQHIEDHKSEPFKTLYSCSICNKKFPSAELCQEHLDTCSPPDLQPAEALSASLAIQKEDSTRKMGLKTGAIPKTKFECTPCEKKFLSKMSFNLHTSHYHGPAKNVECDECDRKFVNLRGLTTHKTHAHKISKKRKKFKCENCEVVSFTREGLEHHMKNEHESTKQLSVKQSPPPKKQKENTDNNPVEDKALDKDILIQELQKRIIDLEKRLTEREDKPKQEIRPSDPKVAEIEPGFETVVRGPKRTVETQKSPGIPIIETVFGQIFLCDKCEDIFKTEKELKTHKGNKHTQVIREPTAAAAVADEMVCHLRCEDGQCQCATHFSCTLCKDKFSDHSELLKHRKEKHPSNIACKHGNQCNDQNLCRFKHEEEMEVVEVAAGEVIPGEEQMEVEPQVSSEKCNQCDMKFNTKKDLRKHIGENHKTFQPCRSFPNGNCEFDGDCRFNHVILGANEHICFKCGHLTTSKTLLMRHVREHNIPCAKYKKRECRFSSSSCIFSHEVEPQEQRTSESQATPVTSRPAPQQQDFRQAVLGHKPPDTIVMKNKLLSLFTMMLEQMPPQALPQLMSQLQK